MSHSHTNTQTQFMSAAFQKVLLNACALSSRTNDKITLLDVRSLQKGMCVFLDVRTTSGNLTNRLAGKGKQN